MSNRFRLLFVLLLFVPALILADTKLTLSDLETLCNKSSWSDVNIYLSNKGWEYYDSSSELVTAGVYDKTVVWCYNKTWGEETAEGWLNLYTDGAKNGRPAAISLVDSSNDAFNRFISSLKSKGYNLVDSEINTNKTKEVYRNSNFRLTILMEKEKSKSYLEEYRVRRTYSIIKLGGHYDGENGEKTQYYSNGTVKSICTLKNNEKVGIYKEFYDNGTLKVLIDYSKNSIKQYDSAGHLSVETSIKGDRLRRAIISSYNDVTGELECKADGLFSVSLLDLGGTDSPYLILRNKENSDYTQYYYENHNVSQKIICKFVDGVGLKDTYDAANNHIRHIELLNDSLHGDCWEAEYEDGLIKSKSMSHWVEGKKMGKCSELAYKTDSSIVEMSFYIDKDGEFDGDFNITVEKSGVKTPYIFRHYRNGIQIGRFQDVDGDTLKIGAYDYEGKLHGTYLEFIEPFHFLTGGLISTDTTTLQKTISGSYSHGARSGHWRFYEAGFFVNGNGLIAEGDYVNDLQSGEWKYYYRNPTPIGEQEDDYVALNDSVIEVIKSVDKPKEKVNVINATSHAGELYLVEHYKAGLLHGDRIRYSSLDKNYHDSTYRAFNEVTPFVLGKEHGPYKCTLSDGTLITGSYLNGKRDGSWWSTAWSELEEYNGSVPYLFTFEDGKWSSIFSQKGDSIYKFYSRDEDGFQLQTYIIQHKGSQLDTICKSVIEYEFAIPFLEYGLLNEAVAPIIGIYPTQKGLAIYIYSNAYQFVENGESNFYESVTGLEPFSGKIEYEDNSKKYVLTVKKGKLNGTSKIYDLKSGKLIEKQTWKNGVRSNK